MKHIRPESVALDEANRRLGVDMEPGFWEFLVRSIAYPELVFDAETSSIRYPGYVPFEELAREWIDGMESGIYDVRLCARCAGYFDVNTAEGIFGRPEELEEFICMPCAETMTAREFYERFVER